MSEQREVHVDPARKEAYTGMAITQDLEVRMIALSYEKRPEPPAIIEDSPRKARRSDEWPPRKKRTK